MRKLIVSEFLSLDGVMEDPKWTFRYWNDETALYKHDELFTSDALVLGRVTYEGFAAAWPGRSDGEGYADRMNSLPKYVVSSTLDSAEWNNTTLIRKNAAERIAELKRQPVTGGNLLVFGSGILVQMLLLYNLVDQFNLLVYPLLLGKGKRLFRKENSAVLKLVDAKTFASGVVALTYRPDEKSGV